MDLVLHGLEVGGGGVHCCRDNVCLCEELKVTDIQQSDTLAFIQSGRLAVVGFQPRLSD